MSRAWSFEGRVGRAEWWTGLLAAFGINIAAVAAVVLIGFLTGGNFNPDIWYALLLRLLAAIAGIIVLVAASVKRFHDRGKSGWWTLIGLIPAIGPIWFLVELGLLEGEPRTNRYGAPPPAAGNVEPAIFLVLLTMLLFAPAAVYPVFLMKVLCFALFACAFNLLIGYVGLLSFGHAMFFGFAAYVAGYTVKVFGCPTEVGILAGTAVAAAMGFVAGSIAIRRQGIYFAMVTLALAQMVFFLCVQAKFTGGEDGIQAIPRRPLFGLLDIRNDFIFYYVVLAIFAAGFLIIYRTIHSPFGQVLKAIRENEARAISLGYAVDRVKLIAFVLSATLSGLAGATKAFVFQLASLTDVAWQMSGEVVLMTLVGGMGTVFGPIVGAGVIVTMQNYLAGFGEWVLVIQGAIFVITVLLFRRGIVGEVIALRSRFTRRQAAEIAEVPAHG